MSLRVLSRAMLNYSCFSAMSLLAVLGCGYTQLKSSPPSIYRQKAEQVSSSWKLDSICATWEGVVLTRMNGTTISVDSIYTLTIYPDSTWELENDRGLFAGQWSFRDNWQEKPEFSFSIHSKTTGLEFNKTFIGYFRDWGLQLYSTHDGPHMISVEWDLTR